MPLLFPLFLKSLSTCPVMFPFGCVAFGFRFVKEKKNSDKKFSYRNSYSSRRQRPFWVLINILQLF